MLKAATRRPGCHYVPIALCGHQKRAEGRQLFFFFLRISQKPLCCCRGRSLPRWAYIPFENKNKMAKSGEAVTWQQGRARWWCKWRNRGGQNKKYINFFFFGWNTDGRSPPFRAIATLTRMQMCRPGRGDAYALWLYGYFLISPRRSSSNSSRQPACLFHPSTRSSKLSRYRSLDGRRSITKIPPQNKKKKKKENSFFSSLMLLYSVETV